LAYLIRDPELMAVIAPVVRT